MKTEVKVPTVGESITEATIGEWMKKSGDFVRRDEVLLALETDKASVEVVAENEGVIEITAQEGDTVEIGATVATIDTSAEAPAGEVKPSSPSASQPQAEASAGASSAGAGQAHQELRSSLSPATGRVVHERGLDPNQIEGSGRGGRITKEDALRAQPSASQQPQQAPPAKTEIPPLPQARLPGTQGKQRREKMSTLRRRIAERLVQAQQTAAILTTFNEVDMTQIIQARKTYKDAFKERHGVSLGFMGFFTKAAVQALKESPAVNGFIDGNELVYNDYFNIGIAVGTEKGLIVPVVRDADQLSLAEIELAIRHYALKARDGKISPDDLSGGTFTISNGGVYGSLLSTPILNPPQSAILGMHKMEERAVVINGKVEVRTMMYLALSYDHRIIDGKEAVSFLVRIKECLEDPQRLLLEI